MGLRIAGSTGKREADTRGRALVTPGLRPVSAPPISVGGPVVTPDPVAPKPKARKRTSSGKGAAAVKRRK